jgi:tetratricopeptide (TPR) repeat protein
MMAVKWVVNVWARRRTLAIALTLVLLAVLLWPLALDGHAGVHERLKDMNKRIAADPNNADLYIKRGELHRLHRNWDAALADYHYATERDPDSSVILFVRGRMFFEAGRWSEAKMDLDRLLRVVSDHREGLLTRARLLVKLGQSLAAAADYDKVIAGLENPTPEYYLERAKALVSAGPPHIPRALAGVDEGIERLGPIFTLVDFAIDIELTLHRFERALGRLDEIRTSIAPERWFYRRGVILSLWGRTDEAQESYSVALQSFRAAPVRRQSTRAGQEFESELLSLLGSRHTK